MPPKNWRNSHFSCAPLPPKNIYSLPNFVSSAMLPKDLAFFLIRTQQKPSFHDTGVVLNNKTIIIGVDRRSIDKRSKIDSGRSAQHILYSFFLSFFLSFCYSPKRPSPAFLITVSILTNFGRIAHKRKSTRLPIRRPITWTWSRRDLIAVHVMLLFCFISFFLFVMPPKDLAPLSYISPQKTLFQQ